MRGQGSPLNVGMGSGESIQIGEQAGLPVEISHFKLPVSAAVSLGRGTTLKAGSDATLAKVEAARRDEGEASGPPLTVAAGPTPPACASPSRTRSRPTTSPTSASCSGWTARSRALCW